MGLDVHGAHGWLRGKVWIRTPSCGPTGVDGTRGGLGGVNDDGLLAAFASHTLYEFYQLSQYKSQRLCAFWREREGQDEDDEPQ